MDHQKLSAACAAVEAFFTEEEKAKMENSDWRCEGQTFYERIEGYVLGVIETLEDEMENPDLPDEEDDESADDEIENPDAPTEDDQPDSTDDIESSQDSWWWLAVNGPSCAACGFPAQAELLEVRPVPEQLIGFRTREEQLAAQKFLITAPINKVTEYMASLPSKIDAGEVAYVRPRNPEPPTRGPTVWSIAPKQDVSLNEQRP